MARTDTLNNYLTDIATAIKEKKGDTTPINASKFDEEIANLPSGGGDVDEYFKTTVTTETNVGYLMSRLIKKIPPINTSKVFSFSDMFRYYSTIETVPLFDMSRAGSLNGMFYGCTSLISIPKFDTKIVQSFSSMFQNCKSLKTIPELNTSNADSATSMFSGCSAMVSIPELDAQKFRSISYFASNCNELVDFGGLKDLGMGYYTTSSANASSYTLDLSACKKLTYDSLMNVINKLYDIASLGVKTQKLVLGADNLSKLTAEEIDLAVQKGWSVS